MATTDPQITLYTAGTPNGQKISIALEELSLPYRVHALSLPKNDQKQDWYLAINPNGRIPAIVEGGQRVFEGGAILLYLAARHDAGRRVSFAPDSPEHWEMVQWIVWMQSGLGPMQGQANHFVRYAPQRVDYAIERYTAETRRLYGVLEERLAAEEAAGRGAWLVGGRYSFADLASFSWVNWAEWAEISLDAFPTTRRWLAAINARPAVQAGLDVPEKFEMKEAMRTRDGEAAYAKMHSNWVMQGQEAEQAKHKQGT